jgi:23S rRNA pseudouridine1911/1915/1917 synthase
VSPSIKLADRDRDVVWELPILFQDPQVLALNKPPGPDLTAQPGHPEIPALLPLLHEAIAAGKPWTLKLELDYLSPAHRLEPQTSGVQILARSHTVLVELARQFGSATVRQHYLALVRGGPPENRFELDARLSPHPEHVGQMRADSKEGKRCRTQFELVERFRGYSLLRCLPSPGRPGQIGAHLRHARFPLVADPYRGGAGIFLSQLKRDYEPKKGQEERPLIGRPALHLEKVELEHPVGGELLSVTASLAKDFKVALKYLRMFAG